MIDWSRAAWRRALNCTHGDCVEVAFHTGQVAVRDSKDPQGRMLRFNSIEWKAFLDGVRRGDFDFGSP